MRSRSLYQLSLVFALCLASNPLAAQPVGSAYARPARATDIPTTIVHISGTVVSSLDGKPVPRVLVTSPDRRFAALTDWQGRFACDYRMPETANAGYQPFLPGAQFQLQKPGYVHDNGFVRVPAPASGSSSTTVQLRITPESVISGHVSPDTGEIPNNLQVTVRRHQVQEGLGAWVPAGFAQVDRNGEFRFPNLTAGDYLVMTNAHSQPLGLGPRQHPDTVPGLLPTYFPSGSTIAEASRVHVGPGETVSLDLRPTSATLYRISVSVSGISSTDNFNASLVSDYPGFNISTNAATRTIEGYLPPGSYTFRINTYSVAPHPPASTNSGEGPRPMLFAGGPMRMQTNSFAHLTVGSAPVIGQTIAVAPASDIQVNVTRNFTSQQQQPFQPDPAHRGRRAPDVYISLQSADGINTGQISSQADPEGDNVILRNVPEGTYHVRIIASGGYVASATSGATNLLAAPLVVGPNGSSAPIDIALRDDFSQVTFRTQTAQPPAALDQQDPLMILAIPLDAPELSPSPNFFNDQRASLLQYAATPPGRYLVIAGPILRMQALEYRDPEVLRTLTAKGVVVTLSPGEKTAIDVPLLPEEDK